MALKDKYNDDNKNETQNTTTNRNDELRIVMNQLKEIQASLNQIGIDSPRIQMN